MKGIYKITSPTGNIYIGQSIDIERRVQQYKQINKLKNQQAICRSLLKYGVENHVFETVYELPQDVSKDVLNEYEMFFISQYREAGFVLLNIKDGGGGGGSYKHTDEARKLIREKRAKQTNVSGVPKGNIPWNKGKKFFGVKGRKHSEETKEKIRQIRLGKKHTEESKKRVSVNNARYWAGKKMSESQIKVLRDSHMGIPQSEEAKRKKGESLKAYWAKKKKANA